VYKAHTTSDLAAVIAGIWALGIRPTRMDNRSG
jgi:hypothetical protein